MSKHDVYDLKVESVSISEDGKSAEIKIADSAYVDTLPEELREGNLVKVLEKHNRKFIDSVAKVVADETKDIFSNNKKTEVIEAESPFGSGRNKLQVKVRKEVERRNIQTGEVFKSPDMRIAVHWSGVKGTKSYIKSLVNEIKEVI